jgi:CheY-like chemotaxis protein
LLQQSVEVNASYAEKYGVRFRLDGGAADDRVMADPDRLMQVVTNLLSNAAKFSPRGSDVVIRVLSESATLRIEVEDSGPGISEEFRGRIFEKFAQADASPTRRFEGTGLGLSIARKIVEAMNGTIGFSTVLGRGTIFYIDLPRTEAASVAVPTQLSETAAYQILRVAAVAANAVVPRLLYVDDDENVVGVISAALAVGAHIVRAHSWPEAERLLRDEKFDLVVLDRSLADGHGLGLVDRIPALAVHSVPIVILSNTDVPVNVHDKVAAVLIKSQLSAAQVAAGIFSYLPVLRV